jgi:hypothetical protein
MAYVYTSAETWREVANNGTIPVQNTSHMVSRIEHYLEPMVKTATHKGRNEQWYTDQRLLTILLNQWAGGAWLTQIHHEGRRPKQDRIDRSHWKVKGFANKLDAHLLNKGYMPSNWAKTNPLLSLMYGGENSCLYKWCDTYHSVFLYKLNQSGVI